MSTSENNDMSSEGGRATPAMVEKFVIRLPSGLRNKIKQLSEQNRRSMNSEIIMVLEKHIQQCLMSSTPGDFSEFTEGMGAPTQLTDKQLTEKLESLPPEKKEALLELLG